jgi:hypothetical protein
MIGYVAPAVQSAMPVLKRTTLMQRFRTGGLDAVNLTVHVCLFDLVP